MKLVGSGINDVSCHISSVNAVVGLNPLLDALASLQLGSGVENLLSEAGVALDRAVHLASNHRFESALDAVAADNLDVFTGLQAGFLDGLDRTSEFSTILLLEIYNR